LSLVSLLFAEHDNVPHHTSDISLVDLSDTPLLNTDIETPLRQTSQHRYTTYRIEWRCLLNDNSRRPVGKFPFHWPVNPMSARRVRCIVKIINATYRCQNSFLPTSVLAFFFLLYPAKMKRPRTIFYRKLLRSGIQGEDVLGRGSVGGLIRAEVINTTQTGYRIYAQRENQQESAQIMSVLLHPREARRSDVRILSC
jgi:hypothetical protein